MRKMIVWTMAGLLAVSIAVAAAGCGAPQSEPPPEAPPPPVETVPPDTAFSDTSMVE